MYYQFSDLSILKSWAKFRVILELVYSILQLFYKSIIDVGIP